MLHKTIILVGVVIIGVFGLSGCKKKAAPPEPAQQAVKTETDYQAEAKKQITKDNMAAELDKVEKTMEQESSPER